jgi:hypothetical protein
MNQAYVGSLYQTLLNRPADGGAAGWVNLLNMGVSPMAVVQGIESSMEYRADQVQVLYQRYLHRAADPVGLQAFVNFVGMGGTYEQVAAMLVGSMEYLQMHGGTPAGFVEGLFEDALHRPADAAAQAAFGGLLAQGMSRQGVAAIVLGSLEYRANLVQSDYQEAVSRPASPMEQAAAVMTLQAGFTDQMVLAALLGSAEAFAKRS